MAYINVVMSLKDFISYTEELISKNQAYLYIEEWSNDEFKNNKNVQIADDIDNNRLKYLNFFICTKEINDRSKDFYDESINQFTIEGIGGRETKDALERIALRVISKTPDKNVKKLFNAIKNKLKKDEDIGVGVKGGSAMHKNYFYQKYKVGKKTFITDLHNDKAPIIEVI
ncbi:hypothetical protein M4I21_17390 [Cellulophaga sp. 20_2_10]|uniref:hypothetical protein n=1 Tax=Cellulophaga sp. 20_2_10 TaxID=2942476 RepID=UPI00201AFE22|nr:hypothetical protein [Cellulophaga sp. 20_2_10]MCL5247598.1 hypothetical protein [Cellulophaga sp. 20_2_10]